MYGFEDIAKGNTVRFELPRLKLNNVALPSNLVVYLTIYEETPGDNTELVKMYERSISIAKTAASPLGNVPFTILAADPTVEGNG